MAIVATQSVECGAGLWQADPHQFGPGKTHVVDASEPTKTLCGKWLKATPGQMLEKGLATCKICLNAIENREHRRAMQEHWREEGERRERERAEQERLRAIQNREWWARYDAYLRSPQWKQKAEAVKRRAGGMCEGCEMRKATQVHHLTYKHVFEEFLWELRAICDVCHERVHSSKESHGSSN